ncbi:MAG: cupin domain-containing protein [Pseudomonadota bacterium]
MSAKVDNINGDLVACVVQNSRKMQWGKSPSGTVWRKRLHLVGPPESGQVTSIVRYENNASFPAHDHPDGEEILVLDGVFSDEHGDWPAGTYLLNPEGFRHAPFSKTGCELFVKLRQYPGTSRRQLALNVKTLNWQPTGQVGESEKLLYSQAGYQDVTRLLRWAPGAVFSDFYFQGGAELYVLDGMFEDEFGEYPSGTWLRFPKDGKVKPRTRRGCTLYCKTNGLAYLNDGATQ